MTLLIVLYVLTFNGSGFARMRNVTPLEHGGVVSEPRYWKSGPFWSSPIRSVKSSGPVVVDVPGFATWLMLEMTDVISVVVVLSSVS
jgi:hypothetical protein